MKTKLTAAFLAVSIAGPLVAQCTTPRCSAVIPTATVTASIPAGSQLNGSFRVEARLHGQNWSSGSNVSIFNVGGYGLHYLGGSGIFRAVFFSASDSAVNGYGNCDVVLGNPAPQDLIVRINRDLVAGQVRGEVFDTQTGAQVGQTCVYPITQQAASNAIRQAGVTLGAPSAAPLGGAIAFLRWFNASVPARTHPAVGISTPALLGDWEFDRNASNAVSGQPFAGTLTYVNTPTYNPACDAGDGQTVQIGNSMRLNGRGSNPVDGGTALTYSWTYFAGSDGVNQNPVLTDSGTPTPFVTGLNLFGSANFQLTVTDESGNSSTCVVNHGVVSADANGVINLTAEGLDAVSQKFVGPLIMYGANSWPWADTIHKVEMDIQVNNLANYYKPVWRNAEAGTISVTAGSNIITGSGADLTRPCGGGSTPLNGATLFLIYPGTDGRTHYLPTRVVSCADPQHLQMAMPQGGEYSNSGYPHGSPPAHSPWPDCTSGCSGWGWSWGYYGDTIHRPQYLYGNWLYNPAPANYYDNAKAFYALYLRSGIDTYLKAFETLADQWWEFPVMDQGYACDPAGSSCWAPAAWRSMSLNGIVLRALQEGSASTKWRGLWIVAQLAQAHMANVVRGGPTAVDERETAYAMSMLAYCALGDPDPAHQASCKSTIKSLLASVWTPFRLKDIGNVWGQFSFTNQVPANQATSIPSLGGSGSVCLINGSDTVTGVGTHWTSAENGFEIWFFGGDPAVVPSTNAAGDSVGYGVTVNSTATLTLSSPYAGTTACTGVSGSNRGYLFGYQEGTSTPDPTNGLTGWGALPYMEGMLGTAFGWAAMAMDGYDAPSAALYRAYLDDTVHWIITFGMNPSKGGLYYGTMYVGCVPPISATNVACNSGSPSQTRTLSLDVMRAFAMDYQNTLNPEVKAAADTLMSQMFSKPGTGGPNPDGFYISDFDGGFTTGTPPLGSAPKWAGQLCGFEEACDMWPAVRNGYSSARSATKVQGVASITGKGTVH